jgi:hypothetical protein
MFNVGCGGRLVCKNGCIYKNTKWEFEKAFITDCEIFYRINLTPTQISSYRSIGTTADFTIDGKFYNRRCTSHTVICLYMINNIEYTYIFVDEKFTNLIINSKKCVFRVFDRNIIINKQDKEGIKELIKLQKQSVLYKIKCRKYKGE